MARNSVGDSGSYNVLCDRCGFKYKNHQLRKEWTGAMVCFGPGTNGCYEPRHEQDLIRARNDTHVLPFIRSDSAGADVGPALNCSAIEEIVYTVYEINSLGADLTIYSGRTHGSVTIPVGVTVTVLCNWDID